LWEEEPINFNDSNVKPQSPKVAITTPTVEEAMSFDPESLTTPFTEEAPKTQPRGPTPKHEFENHENHVLDITFLHDNVHIASGS
jgi:hypothetical protein